MLTKMPTGNMVSQSDFNKGLGEDMGVTTGKAAEWMGCIQDRIQAALKRGDGVSLRIGKFKRADREARMGRNPRTGEQIEIAAKNGVKFTPSKLLKDALN